MIRGTGIDSTVKLCIQAQGVSTSNKFFDKSQSRHTVTPSGNAQMSNAKAKFESAGVSMYFDGNVSSNTPDTRLTIPASVDFNFGIDPFFVGMWVNTTQAGGTDYGSLIAFGFPSSGAVSGEIRMGHLFSGASNFMIGYYTTKYVNCLSDIAVNDGDWHYVAMLRDADFIGGYIDGVECINETISTSLALGNSTNSTYVGYNATNTNTRYNGYIDDIVVRTGVSIDGTKVPTRRLG